MTDSGNTILLIIGLIGLALIGGALFLLTKAPEKKGGSNTNNVQPGMRERRDSDPEDMPDFNLTEKEFKDLQALKNKPKKRKKFLAKLEKKHKKAMTRAEVQEQNEQEPKLSKYEERQQKKEKEREEKEQKRLEEAKKAKDEAEKKATEEFDDWKNMFETTEEGTDKLSSEEAGNLLGKFVEYIKRKKVVLLEDLAIDFGITCTEAVDRVVALEASGAITGVIDDRGKFIYVSTDEMTRVADFVRKRGRVTISELVRESNSIIDLTEREEVDDDDEANSKDVQEIMEERGESNSTERVETVYEIETTETERSDGLRKR
jgi:DDRGK domain-containing protein 1